MGWKRDENVENKNARIAGRYHLLTGIITASITLVPSIMKIGNLQTENERLSASNTKLKEEKKALAGENKKLSSSQAELKKENKKLNSDAEIHKEGIRVLLKNVTGNDYTGKDIKVIETENEITFVAEEEFIWAD